MHLRIKRGLATLAVPTIAAGLLAAGSPAIAASHLRPAETTVCNNSTLPCTNVSNLLLNQGNYRPDFILHATTVGGTNAHPADRKLNLSQASDSLSSEDFTIRFIGTVSQLCGLHGANGLDPTSYACLTFSGSFPVIQQEFSPDSNASGYCVGAASVAQGQPARLEKCGSPRTFFVADLTASITVTVPAPFQPLVYFPLEYAADTSASSPLVLTLHTRSSDPADGLFLEQEKASGGRVPDSQMFTLTDPVGFTF
jgi:hypothetical protein